MSKPVRLSDSTVWGELLNFYDTQGEAAWTSGAVPFFATNNPSIAKTYVDLFLAFLEDCNTQGLVESEQPATILELGGGLGRLAYLILARLKQMQGRFPCKVRYLLTDYAQTNVDYYKNHERLKPFIEEGLLEVSRVDAESGEGCPSLGTNPVFAIGNYLFDTLSHDGFRVRSGQLYEATVEKTQQGNVEFTYQESTQGPYDNEVYNGILRDYCASLGETHLPFPVGPLRCLQWLSGASGGAMAFMMGDKTLRTTEEFLDFASLPMQKHDQGFSMTVNCHAIDQVWKSQDGLMLHSAPRSNPLNLALYYKGLSTDTSARTRQVFEDQINGFGPLDYLDFRAHIVKVLPDLSLELCLQMLRLSFFDAELFYELNNKLGSFSLEASLEEQREVFDVMVRCWDNFFPIADDRDVPFAVARVLACVNQFDQSINFYRQSLHFYGEKALTHHNIAICYFNMGKLNEAEESLHQALAIEAQHDASKSLLVRVEQEKERQAQLKS